MGGPVYLYSCLILPILYSGLKERNHIEDRANVPGEREVCLSRGVGAFLNKERGCIFRRRKEIHIWTRERMHFWTKERSPL